ncbi:adenylate/guanylate cyclase domain-containing protein [Roseospira navarrensis]|uniref:Adenylate/guanylate cyclase domain-containing protein n=1 Tax=Roseospira navarrensis TaxID=140058 RepID=A0A7X1ZEM4_9PROT|nr:adenylate/guanylate cyclase domain-containing protein [Roseospira navarrensis]MQX37091.1 adenylate/guanylate cyclase domain-containing protein [Roseospira navarrensis]
MNGDATVLDPAAPTLASESWRRNDIVRWLLEDGWRTRTPEALLSELCPRLIDAGVPADRVNLSVRLLHPQVFSLVFIWQPGQPIKRLEGAYAILDEDRFRLSPLKDLSDGDGAVIRRRITGPAASLDYPILHDLAAEGFTDYLALGLPFSDGRHSAITLATRAPGGFDAAHLALIDDAAPALARVVEIMALRHTSLTLMQTYLGRQTGARVLDGQIRRGDSDVIQAVIWFCDLRGSTRLAEAMNAACFLETLNGYFDAMAGAVLDHGGEVLRYIGDAALAIFPYPAGDTEGADPAPARAAMDAARDAGARMAALNAERLAADLPPLGHGIGLHVGRVTYGNIGVQTRLEFTVIGAAANLAARVEGLCKTLDEPVVVSAAFRERHPGPWRALGRHALRGVDRPEAVYAPA